MDIKISLEIGLSPSLEGFLTKILGDQRPAARAVEAAPKAEEYVDFVPMERVEEALPQAEAPAKRKGRLPKAGAVAPDTFLFGDQKEGEVPSGSSAGQTATQSDASRSEGLAPLFGDAPAVAITDEDVKKAMNDHLSKFGDGNRTQEVLKKHANGAGSFKRIEPQFYGPVYSALMAELEG